MSARHTFLQSFSFAFRGLAFSLKGQRNIKIQLFFGIFALLCTIIFPISKIEQLLVIFIIFLVLILEVLNTALEKTVDAISTEQDPRLGAIKDMAAGAVLLAAMLSVIMGIAIFGPHFWAILKSLI
jgi:diacylglycerol kinase